MLALQHTVMYEQTTMLGICIGGLGNLRQSRIEEVVGKWWIMVVSFKTSQTFPQSLRDFMTIISDFFLEVSSKGTTIVRQTISNGITTCNPNTSSAVLISICQLQKKCYAVALYNYLALQSLFNQMIIPTYLNSFKTIDVISRPSFIFQYLEYMN